MIRHHARFAAAITVALLLAGCTTPPPTGDELFEQARQANFAFKETIADIQLQFHDGNWFTPTYGSSPSSCNGEFKEFKFHISRYTEVPWWSPVSATEATDSIGAWLVADGWSDVQRTTYDPPITDVVVTAKNPDAGIAKLQINISIGVGVEEHVTDMISIDATSTCHPGSSYEIGNMLADADPYGASDVWEIEEPPTATPWFGGEWPTEWVKPTETLKPPRSTSPAPTP